MTDTAVSRTLTAGAGVRYAAVRQLATTLLVINQRHERLVDGLLTLAGSEQTIIEPTEVDLADIARDVVADRQALRYNLPDHGGVEVTTDTAGDDAQLTVENTGPVIHAYDIPGLFQPIRRLPATDRVASQGAGLGLPIVAAIAQAHGGIFKRGHAKAADSLSAFESPLTGRQVQVVSAPSRTWS